MEVKEKKRITVFDFTCVLTTGTELFYDNYRIIIRNIVSCSISECTPGTKPVTTISPLTESGNIGSICSDKVLAKYSLNFDLRLLFV